MKLLTKVVSSLYYVLDHMESVVSMHENRIGNFIEEVNSTDIDDLNTSRMLICSYMYGLEVYIYIPE